MTDADTNDSDNAMKKFDLYIKASAIDKETKGACPICQQWFMITCLVGELQDDIDFKVYTVQSECTPKYFAAGWSKKYPVVMVNSGRNKKSVDISGLMYDTFEELEEFFDGIINENNKNLKRHNTPNKIAMSVVENLYRDFNHYIASDPKKNVMPEKTFRAELKKLNDHLEGEDQYFIVEDRLSFADCHLLPRLQHIRVACKAFHDFDIPKELSYVWRYLSRAYGTDAFQSTMPSDQDIIFNYLKKAPSHCRPRINGKLMGNPTLAQFTYTTEVPDEFLEEFKTAPEKTNGTAATPVLSIISTEPLDEDRPGVEPAGGSDTPPEGAGDAPAEEASDDPPVMPSTDDAPVVPDTAPSADDEAPATTFTNGAPDENGSIGSGSTHSADDTVQ